MSERNQEGYRTLGWIINKSEQGLFLVVANEMIQKEIVDLYRQGEVEVYDYKLHPGRYSFQDLQKWVTNFPEIQVFMNVNFHLAIQDEESLKRLNFSRDVIEGLGKNFIFLVTPYGDDQLATKAYDFYSFVKLRILFQSYQVEVKKELFYKEDELMESIEEGEWNPEELKQKQKETYLWMEQAKEEEKKAHHKESEKLLLKVREVKKSYLEQNI